MLYPEVNDFLSLPGFNQEIKRKISYSARKNWSSVCRNEVFISSTHSIQYNPSVDHALFFFV